LANATMEIRIINTAGGGDTGWIQCAGTSCTFAGSVGNYFLASDITARLDPLNPFLDLSYSTSTTNANAGTIIIESMATSYTINNPQFELIANGNSNINTTDNTVAAYGGSNNAICPAGINACAPGGITNTITGASFATPPAGYAFIGVGPGNSINPYSLALSFSLLNPSSSGTASGDLMLTAVPEPASIALLGGVLLLSMGLLRHKLRLNS
jgi:hypothetical protein